MWDSNSWNLFRLDICYKLITAIIHHSFFFSLFYFQIVLQHSGPRFKVTISNPFYNPRNWIKIVKRSMTLMNFHLNTTNNSSINFISFFNSSINLTVIIFKSSVKKHLEELCGKFLLSGKQLKISSVWENEAQKFQILSQDKNYS